MNRRNFLKVAVVAPAAINSVPVLEPFVRAGTVISLTVTGWGPESTAREFMLRKELALKQISAVMNASFYHGSATLRRSKSNVDDWEVIPELPC